MAAEEAPASEGEASTEAAGPCDIVCEQPIVDKTERSSDHDWEEATANAHAVVNEMEEDFLACYTKRLVAKPTAHAFMTMDIIVGPNGKVKNVELEGGALLGEEARECIAARARAATFDPPRGGGTMRVQVPFSLRRAESGEAD